MVDYAQATQKSNVDGHVMFRHSVHGRGDKGGLECDALGDRGVEGDFGGGEALRASSA